MLVPCSFHPTWLLFSFSSREQSPNLKLLIIGIISSETPWEEPTENGFLASPCWLLEREMRDGRGFLRTSLCSKLQEAFLVLLLLDSASQQGLSRHHPWTGNTSSAREFDSYVSKFLGPTTEQWITDPGAGT